MTVLHQRKQSGDVLPSAGRGIAEVVLTASILTARTAEDKVILPSAMVEDVLATQAGHRIKLRSLSEGEVIAPMVLCRALPSVSTDVGLPDGSSGSYGVDRRRRAVSDMSSLSGSASRAVAQSPATSFGDPYPEQQHIAEIQPSEALSAPTATAVIPSTTDHSYCDGPSHVSREESVVSWIWQWGALPVKSKSKSLNDLRCHSATTELQSKAVSSPATEVFFDRTRADVLDGNDCGDASPDHDHDHGALQDFCVERMNETIEPPHNEAYTMSCAALSSIEWKGNRGTNPNRGANPNRAIDLEVIADGREESEPLTEEVGAASMQLIPTHRSGADTLQSSSLVSLPPSPTKDESTFTAVGGAEDRRLPQVKVVSSHSQVQVVPSPSPWEDCDEATTTTDHDELSLQDIDLDDISPEPAGGDFYDSDTDSYLSLSLDDSIITSPEQGPASYGSSSSKDSKFPFQGQQQQQGNGKGKGDSSREHEAAAGSTDNRRRYRKYRYRKVLVPAQEQLNMLGLLDGGNEVQFHLDGCAPLRSQLFVWPEDARIVVTDLEGVFSKNSTRHSTGVWVSFLGGGSHYSMSTVAAASKNKSKEMDHCIRLFAGLHKQGYRVIYIAQSSPGSTSPPLLSSKEYLSSIKASTGECLPPGPIFKSPESLVRAFGASRTDVFKASALRGVKSLFPAGFNPYHACFCTRESDLVPFSRFGFPEGRIFLVTDSNEIKSANRTFNLNFAKMHELLQEIFPPIADKAAGTVQYSTVRPAI